MANWRWVYNYMVKVGELVVLPMCMCVGVGWVVGLKTLTFLVLVLAVINESLRGCFMHFYTVAPRRAVHESRPVVNLIRLGSCGVWGHLLVLVCVGVDLFGLKTFTFVVLAIVVLKGFLRLFDLRYYTAGAWRWLVWFLESEETWHYWLTVLSVVFLNLKSFIFLVLVCVVAFIIEGPLSHSILSDRMNCRWDGFLSLRGQMFLLMCSDRMNRRWDGFVSLRGQMFLLMCVGVGLVGLKTFTFITLGVVAIEGFLAILAVAVASTHGHGVVVGFIQGPLSPSILSNLMDWRQVTVFLVLVCTYFIIEAQLRRLVLRGGVFLIGVGLKVFTLTPPVVVTTIEGVLLHLGLLAIVVGVLLHLALFAIVVRALILRNQRRRAIANDLAHALEMLQKVEAKLLFVDPYPYSERCKGWHPSVKDVCNKVEKFLNDDDDDDEKHNGCSLGLCSTCKEAQKLLKNANDLAREGKRFVTELRELQRQDRILIYEHKYKTLHGMAMAFHWMKVLDFVEGGDQTAMGVVGASSSWLLRIWGRMRGVGKTTAMMGIWGMRGVGKTTLLRCVRDFYAHDADSPFDHVFLLGAGGGAGCTVDRLRHALSVNVSGHPHPPPHHTSSDVVASTISRYLKGKSFLLLLDDVRDRLDLAAVGLPVPLGHSQKVVFTTRYPGVCAEMGCGTSNTVIHMECLEEDEAWSLFKDKAGDEVINANPHIKHLANKMVAECHGLPSALCTLGRAMSTKRDIKEWRYAYNVLLKCKPPHHQVDDEIQEMDDEGYSHLHQLEDALRDSCIF